ncbi:hypothetical protein NDU88_002873 [Pleurodeles waltl]|uniref:Uncharacterized protein n=1 Tax=Pleurodeles waltl TaxID=8319 RepID=A0AAV7WPW0_PLEWA|nr:hypothetical protein NDU88_002873 [Pleurodeles waltl]
MQHLGGARSQSLTWVSDARDLQGPGSGKVHGVRARLHPAWTKAANWWLLRADEGAASCGGRLQPVSCSPVRTHTGAAAAVSGPTVSGAGDVLAVRMLEVLAVVQVSVLPVVEGGTSPSPASSDGWPLGMLLLIVVMAAAVQVQVAVLAVGMLAVLPAVHVVGLSVLMVDTRPPPAGSDA